MMSSTATTIFVRAIAFAGTAVFSVALVNSLPRVRQQRQRSFVEATLDGNLSRMRWLHLAGAKVDGRCNLGNPLSLAAGEGKLDAVRYVLDEGAYGNTSDVKV